jgi:hypothetical protein
MTNADEVASINRTRMMRSNISARNTKERTDSNGDCIKAPTLFVGIVTTIL